MGAVGDPQRPVVLDDFRHHIDQMITMNPTITAVTVWANLIDHHHATMSYGSVRTYVTRQKTTPAPLTEQT